MNESPLSFFSVLTIIMLADLVKYQLDLVVFTLLKIIKGTLTFF